MGLFEKKKKDAERCPICGKEISFFSGLVIADGTICDDCEKMVRGQFNIEEYYGRENWKISTSDPLKAMTVEELKDMINEKKAEQTQVVEEIGGDYAAIAKVEKTFGIAPKATDVGLKRAKALKNRIVATSYIMSGEFSRGDAVTVSFAGIQCSYSKKAYPWDNACIESFHSLIKREWLNRFKIRDYDHAYRLVFEYLEAFYNTKRIHSHCDYMSPNDYEELYRRIQKDELLMAS